jgi:hypothetical protein
MSPAVATADNPAEEGGREEVGEWEGVGKREKIRSLSNTLH